MIRVVLFLMIVGALALGVAWLADRPGDVVVTWQGWRIETSLMVLGSAMLAATAVLLLLWMLLRALLLSPSRVRAHLHRRRGEQAYEAISRGLIAIGAGDLAAARKHTAAARRIAPAEPLALLLGAQHAQLAGDRTAADSHFREMASRADTKAVGLRGLFIEAQRRGDHASAHALAEEAVRHNPSLGWAGKAVLERRCAVGDWAGALALLEGNKRALDKESYRRQRAVMLTARALALEETDRDSAKAFALEAAKLSPPLVPAAALAGRMLAEGGEPRKARRILDRAWLAHPHPHLAEVYAQLRFGDTARDRLKRMEALAQKMPGHIEGALALARAAIDAQQYAKARAALAPHLAALSKRVALLMAELERAERNDEGRAREWIARAVHAAPDPAWTADGHVSDHWLPVSPLTGRLDAFEWRVPLAGIPSPTTAIHPEPPAVASAVASSAPSDSAQIAHKDPATIADEKSGTADAAAEFAIPPSRRRGRSLEPKAEAVIPLVHAPDDPGPDATEESESPGGEQKNGGWPKIF